ncbi:pantoate--beta-alanine ligase [Priestia taiwanensis]|uniref:Pantothenate synthetase n=1 Tax=Priestia taiwanensis TaxID=1347902 RepID=A0A917AJI4_9BACI|nr:pantoate--beta-alanine ligase [Priestia taiwanensis]MBM7361728.1 pantoate--beta-alanine ligase [Priestia taiwanensis]GGE56487.1 pantothenate synthetase [Priestia taiwanensis]
MRIIHSIHEMQTIAKDLHKEGKTIGFVPTMGYLHEGHATLLKQSRAENDIVVLSVFVNPLQFGPNEDFEQYPRDSERDESIAQSVGVNYLFYPTSTEMYPMPLATTMTAVDRVDVLCGAKREGHFDGVVTVLAKLFNIVLPDRVYMGMKDAQQVAVVQGLVDDYNIPVEIVRVPTVREEDGLAKSSRNVYLTDQERKEAVVLSRSLELAQEMIHSGETSAESIISFIEKEIVINTSGTVDYVEIYAYPTLKQVDVLEGQLIIALAVRFSKARLIDNTVFVVHANKGEEITCSVQ